MAGAFGGGFRACLLFADIRIASTEAKFRLRPAVNVGLMASTYRLPRTDSAAPPRAKAMLLTGLPHDAETAERYGPDHRPACAGRPAPRRYPRARRNASPARAPPVSGSHQAPPPTRAPRPFRPDDWGANRRRRNFGSYGKSADHKAAVAAFRDRKDPVFTRS